MTSPAVLVERPRDQIALVTLNRPERRHAMNLPARAARARACACSPTSRIQVVDDAALLDAAYAEMAAFLEKRPPNFSG